MVRKGGIDMFPMPMIPSDAIMQQLQAIIAFLAQLYAPFYM